MKALKLVLFSVMALFPICGNSETRSGHESNNLKVEITAFDTDARILTLRITNSDSEPYILAARKDGTPPQLGQPEFWFIFPHPHPNIEWFYEDARKGSWEASSHQVTLAPGETQDFIYFLHGFRRQVEYWFYDPKANFRFKITDRIEHDSGLKGLQP